MLQACMIALVAYPNISRRDQNTTCITINRDGCSVPYNSNKTNVLPNILDPAVYLVLSTFQVHLLHGTLLHVVNVFLFTKTLQK